MKQFVTDEIILKDKNKRPVIKLFRNCDYLDVNLFIDKTKKKGSKITNGQACYTKVYDAIWNYIFLNYKRKDNFVKVVFEAENNPKEKKFTYLTIAELLIHMMFWRVHVTYAGLIKKRIPIDETNFYDLSVMDSKVYCKMMENVVDQFIEEAQERKDGINELSFYTSMINDEFMDFINGYCVIAGNTISLYDIHQLEKRSKLFKTCIHTELDENKTPHEIGVDLANGKKAVMESIIADGKSQLAPYVKAKRMSDDQFTQMFFAVGPRTDVDKTILPKIIKGNFLHGYSSPSDLYIDGIAGRDAQILKHITVRDSGYLSRKINLSNLNTRIDYNVKDCGTDLVLTYFVKDQDNLKSIDLKYQVLDDGKLHLIRAKKDKHLIGQTIKIRSHIYCKCPEGTVCLTCFGRKALRLIGTNIGGLPSIKFANPISKRLMRAKHFQTATAKDTTNDEFEKYFLVEGSKVFINPEFKEKDCYIVIDRDYIEDIIDGAKSIEDESVDTDVPIDKIEIQHGLDEGIRTIIDLKDSMNLVLTPEIMEENKRFIIEYESDECLIPIDKINKDNPVFNMVVITEAVSLYLKQIKNTIDSNATKSFESPDALIAKISNLLINMGIGGSALINIETLVYQLMRSNKNLFTRPNFAKDPKALENTNLLPLSSSILKKDINSAFAFERLKSVITDIDSFKQYKSGIFDPLFAIKKPFYLSKIDKKTILAVLASKETA